MDSFMEDGFALYASLIIIAPERSCVFPFSNEAPVNSSMPLDIMSGLYSEFVRGRRGGQRVVGYIELHIRKPYMHIFYRPAASQNSEGRAIN